MRNELIQYVKLLFAGNPGTEEIQEEILQNTLERYDDLISQGSAPEKAYRLAISGIGDIEEILGTPEDETASTERPKSTVNLEQQEEIRQITKKTISRAGVILYFMLSFLSGAWHITWLIFPLMAAVRGLAFAILDYMEENK